VVIKVRAKSVRRKWLKVSARDVTPFPLTCPETSEVVEVEGLDIEQEMRVDP
jgi:hypothetical protein